MCRPLAPSASALAPYLERLDEARWYSNFGQLTREFESRLAQRFVSPTHVVTAANGTLALSLALRARVKRDGLCLMPAWTFVATAHAAMLAGLTPYLADVEDVSGALTPEMARQALKAAPEPVEAIVPVAPHGAVIDLAAWAALEAETGVPVVVDAAAGFDTTNDAPVPVIVSLHATKVIGVGEGGFIATRDEELAHRMRALSVFGFSGSRESKTPAFNAKLSEYASAVGLAGLDAWPATRARFLQTGRLMRMAFAVSPDVTFQAGWGATWIGATCVARVANADLLERRLAAQDIETRRWWGAGLHREPAFRGAPRANDLSTTNRLAATTIGLPFALDMPVDDIARIAFEVANPLNGAR